MDTISTLTQIHLLLVRAETLAAENHPEIFARLQMIMRDVEQQRDAARARPPGLDPLLVRPTVESSAEFAIHMVEVADTLTILGASLGADISALLKELGDQIRERAKAEMRLN